MNSSWIFTFYLQSRPSDNPKHQMHIIVTLVLLQTIGFLHQTLQLRASSEIYFGLLVLVPSLSLVSLLVQC